MRDRLHRSERSMKNVTVLVDDLIGSERPERLAYQDRFEKLRDPSHTISRRQVYPPKARKEKF
jgi:hypothetical protein